MKDEKARRPAVDVSFCFHILPDHSSFLRAGSDNTDMALQQVDPMSRLVDAANRLRQVREAQRYFLDLWALELSENESGLQLRGNLRSRRSASTLPAAHEQPTPFDSISPDTPFLDD